MAPLELCCEVALSPLSDEPPESSSLGRALLPAPPTLLPASVGGCVGGRGLRVIDVWG